MFLTKYYLCVINSGFNYFIWFKVVLKLKIFFKSMKLIFYEITSDEFLLPNYLFIKQILYYSYNNSDVLKCYIIAIGNVYNL